MIHNDRDKLRSEIVSLIEKYGKNRSSLIPVLQEIQKNYSYISEYAMQIIADILNIHPVEVYGVVSFYSFLDEKPKGKFMIRLCRSLSCDFAGKNAIARQLENELGIKFGESTEDGKFSLEWTNCLGMCDQGPAMMVNDQIFVKLTPAKAHDIIEGCKKVFGPHAMQKMQVLRSNVEESRAKLTFDKIDSNAVIEKLLSMKRSEVIDEIIKSGLKGRGGAGFPTGIKWNLTASAKDENKFVVCNADEGEPGTFKDRTLMTRYADLLFTGMIVAGYAVGAKKGYLYLRGEYTYIRDMLEKVMEERRKNGFLGKIKSADFSFDIEIRMGAGAYVCGEETALIESLEGFRGEPRNRPPFPVDTGFQGHPTTVNNVETLLWAAAIIGNGADWFKKFGTEKSPGLKILSISGDCKKPGIYEYPFGVKISKILKDVGAEDAKAVQIGGASGQCIPAKNFERAIAFEDIATGGSVIIIGPNRCMTSVAHNFLEFFVDESCGQCNPCRLGTVKLLETVEKLMECKCSIEHLNEVLKLGETMQLASKCGLGQSAPNAFISIADNFKDEIMGHCSSN
ncbi:MAG TPA: NADH-quinone oxidoreductase subunit NuoE [Victivallales bacterium]|nr:NADH-quinone oxidoreductase subunit NuoE [Victivallales bacterium]HPO91293.1 NADH-quinone oxidoreductase subunit NuoE [Victivallales bacterium]HRU00332.1 NADH-quinone oxidoreductase subunit NuoE [Victivallales bacterium]